MAKLMLEIRLDGDALAPMIVHLAHAFEAADTEICAEIMQFAEAPSAFLDVVKMPVSGNAVGDLVLDCQLVPNLRLRRLLAATGAA